MTNFESNSNEFQITIATNAKMARADGYSLVNSLISAGIFLTFLNFSNPFTRFSFVFVAKFVNSRRFFLKFLNFSLKILLLNFYGLLRLAFASLAMTTIFTQNSFKFLKNSTQRSQNDTF